MAKYYLSVERKRNEFIPVRWDKLEGNEAKNINLLAEIDEFTSNYFNEDELKIALLNQGDIINDLTNISDIKKPLVIIYKNNGEYKKVRYGLCFKNNKRFLDEMYVLNYLKAKLSDKEFMTKWCNNMSGLSIHGGDIYNIRYYLNNVDKFADYCLAPVDNRYALDAINNIVMRECLKANKNTGEYFLQYKPLRDMGMYLAYQEEKKKHDEEKAMFDSKEIYYQQNIDGTEEPMTYKKKRR